MESAGETRHAESKYISYTCWIKHYIAIGSNGYLPVHFSLAEFLILNVPRRMGRFPLEHGAYALDISMVAYVRQELLEFRIYVRFVTKDVQVGVAG